MNLPISTVEKRSLYTAIMVEPREHPALEFVLLNILNNLNADWSVVLLHGSKNLKYIQKILCGFSVACEGEDKFAVAREGKLEKHLPSIVSRIQYINLGVENLKENEYNSLFFQSRFYEYIPTEMFLVFQTDSMIIPENKEKIYKFIEYDYVGSPWLNTLNNIIASQVGNGGFSLRRKSKMLELLKSFNPNYLEQTIIPHGLNEDVFFCGMLHKDVYVKKPSYEEAKEFSAETTNGIDPFGIHNIWKRKEVYADIVKKYPIVRELERLNTLDGFSVACEGKLYVIN